VEFMRFNPLRNPREAAPHAAPYTAQLKGCKWAGLAAGPIARARARTTPETAEFKVQEEESPARTVERASFNAGQ